MINKVILIGNLGKDPEVRKLESGSAVGKFSMATNESYRDNAGEWQTQTEWHNIVVWRNLAERAERELKKGSLVYIEGKLTHRKWLDQEGKDRYTTEVVARTYRLLEKREGGRTFGDDFPSALDEAKAVLPEGNNPPVVSDAPSPQPAANNSDDLPEADDDLPF